jgi:NADPH:quinone reductase-like Zn-dependent oxidoreductase
VRKFLYNPVNTYPVTYILPHTVPMATQTAIQIKGPGKAEIVTDTPMPKLRDDYIIVKTAAVALNPVDWKQIDHLASPGAIVGCDYSGIVERVGPAVKHGPHVGDRVMGMVHGSEYIACY